ncbi:MarC family protein [Shigella flexneri]
MAIILWISAFLGDTILQLFGISIDLFRIAGHPGGDDSDVDDQRSLARINRTSKKNQKPRYVKVLVWCHWRCLLMAGQGD